MSVVILLDTGPLRLDSQSQGLQRMLEMGRIAETIPGRGQTERLLERIPCWLMQMADACHWYQAVDLPPIWNGLRIKGSAHRNLK